MYHWSPGHLSTALNLNLAWLFSPVFTFKSKNFPTTFKRFRTHGILAISTSQPWSKLWRFFSLPDIPLPLPSSSENNFSSFCQTVVMVRWALRNADRPEIHMSFMTNYAWQGCEVPIILWPINFLVNCWFLPVSLKLPVVPSVMGFNLSKGGFVETKHEHFPEQFLTLCDKDLLAKLSCSCQLQCPGSWKLQLGQPPVVARWNFQLPLITHLPVAVKWCSLKLST